MKKANLKVVSLFISLFTSFSFYEASGATNATGNVTARLVNPISISETTPMNFGVFTSGGVAGTINQAGAVTGGVTKVGSVSPSANVFSVTGGDTGNISYTFTLPSTATITSGANTMTANLSFATGTSSRTLTAGSDTVTINGTLNVPAAAVTGTYTGTYSVSVNY